MTFSPHYLEIERVRFEDRLAVTMVAEPATEDAAIPALLLQPIVENALRHGIPPEDRRQRHRLRDREAIRSHASGDGA